MENTLVEIDKQTLVDILDKVMTYHEVDDYGNPIAAFNILHELEMQMENELEGEEFKLNHISEKYLCITGLGAFATTIFFEVDTNGEHIAFYRLKSKDTL